MIIRVTLAFVLSATLLACTPQGPSRDEVWETIEGCDGDELCSFANVIAKGYSSQIGKPLGRGVSVKSADTDGEAVNISFIVPEKLKNAPTSGGRTPSEQFAVSVARNLCSDPNTRRFFEIGGKLNLSTFFANGEEFSDSTIKSC